MVGGKKQGGKRTGQGGSPKAEERREEVEEEGGEGWERSPEHDLSEVVSQLLRCQKTRLLMSWFRGRHTPSMLETLKKIQLQ